MEAITKYYAIFEIITRRFQMKNTKLVIFDMDGLLFDTERLAFRAFKKSMESAGYPFTLEVYKKFIGLGSKEEIDLLKEIYGDHLVLEPIFKLFKQEFNKLLEKESIRIMPGVNELLNALDKGNIKRCIASSSSLAKIEQYLKVSNLTNRFDFYISGEEVSRGKPNPDIFLEACRRADVDLKNALVLEDSLNGLRAAKNASIKCIVIPDLIEQNGEMKRDAYHITDNLANLVDSKGNLRFNFHSEKRVNTKTNG